MVDGMKHNSVARNIKATTVDSGTNAPLPYVNVGEFLNRVSPGVFEGIVL